MKKKLITTLLATAMVISTLAGCGSSTTDTTASATEATESDGAASDTEEASGDKVNISLYRATFGQAQVNNEQVKKVQDAINEYIADKINVQITITDIPTGEYTEKANLALANNEINLLWTASWETTIGTGDLYKANAAYDITDLLPGTTLYDSMPESIWVSSRFDGKNYYVPVYKEAYEGYDIMFPLDYATEYGLDAEALQDIKVEDLRELEPYLEWCKTEKELKYPFLLFNKPSFFRMYIDKYDFFNGTDSLYAVDRATDTVVNPTLTQDYLDYCTLMCEWGEKGYIAESEASKTTPDGVNVTKNWGLGFGTCTPDDQESSELRNNQEELYIEGFTGKYTSSNSTLGSCFAITTNSTDEQAKACIDFLGLLFTDNTLADLYTYGIEGEDYTLDEEGKVVTNNENYHHYAWESTSIIPLTLCAGEADNKVQLYEEKNNEAQVSCAAGFRYDITPVEAQYTACATIFDQYGYLLELGGCASADVESTIAEYNKALDDAGYQDVLAEFSRQYEEWKTIR